MTLQTDVRTDGRRVLQYPCFFFEKRGDNKTNKPLIIVLWILDCSTHNLCFSAEIRKIMNTPVNPFYYIKVGFKGVKII